MTTRPGAKKHKQIGHYTLPGNLLGRGQFGEVQLAKVNKKNPPKELQIDEDDYLACKVIRKDNLTQKMQQNLKSEIAILSSIQSPYVIRLFDIQKTANNFYLFMKHCNGGDLDELKRLRGRFSEMEARYFMSQIVQGFQAINQMNVLHRDLKLANILVHFKNADSDMFLYDKRKATEYKSTSDLVGNVDVVIADLGFAKQLDQQRALAETQCGTPLYMAPEVLEGKNYDSKVDVWSLGAVFYEMLTGFTPFTGTSKDDLKKNLKAGSYRFPKNIKLTVQGLDFLNCCLQYDPSQRMSWDQLLHHGYLDYNLEAFMNDQKQNDELMLSYHPNSGMYTTFADENALQKLNDKNAILLNTKNDLYFQQTYEKVLMKYQEIEQEKEKEKQEQIQKIDLAESQLFKKMEDEENLVNEDEELLDGDVDKIMDQFPDQNLVQDLPDQFAQQQFKDIVFEPLRPEEDVDKPCEDSTVVGRSNQVIIEDDSQKLFPNPTPGEVCMEKVSKMAEEPYQKQESTGDEIVHQITTAAKLQGDMEAKKDEAKRKKDEEVKEFQEVDGTEVKRELDAQINESIGKFDDVGLDSVYPLMTSDKDKAKEFIVKKNVPVGGISQGQLDRVFNPENQSNYNIMSVYVQDDYISQSKSK